jgi:hypothetical protein
VRGTAGNYVNPISTTDSAEFGRPECNIYPQAEMDNRMLILVDHNTLLNSE